MRVKSFEAAPISANRLHGRDSVLEDTLRELLTLVEQTLRMKLSMEDAQQHMFFDVCLDGQSYSVHILRPEPDANAALAKLSPRELEIARLIAQGMPNKAVAAALFLRPCTVSTYTKRIFLKLNVNSRTEMVAKVLRADLLNAYLQS